MLSWNFIIKYRFSVLLCYKSEFCTTELQQSLLQVDQWMKIFCPPHEQFLLYSSTIHIMWCRNLVFNSDMCQLFYKHWTYHVAQRWPGWLVEIEKPALEIWPPWYHHDPESNNHFSPKNAVEMKLLNHKTACCQLPSDAWGLVFLSAIQKFLRESSCGHWLH